MHRVRDVCNLFFCLILIFCIIFPAVYADEATNISNTGNSSELVNETMNQSESTNVTMTTTEPPAEPTVTETVTMLTTATTEPTPEPTVTETVQPDETLLPAVNKTTTPVPTESLVVTTATTKPTPKPAFTKTILSKGTILTAVTEITTPIPTEGTYSSASSVSDGIDKSARIKHPRMHMSKAQLDEEEEQFQTKEKYSPVRKKILIAESLVDGYSTSKSLLSYISYVPAERDQGYCGNCWVWASTGALEVDHAVKTGVNERLSIQYFNSKYNDGQGYNPYSSDNWACCGGNIQRFASWYSSDKSPIPWSNTNADFGDYYTQCEDAATAIPVSTISTDRHFGLNSISYSPVATNGSGITQSTAIANIKSAIDNNQAVYYSFNYGSTGWTAFENYWYNQAESVIWNPDSYGRVETAGGHGVLIVGYDTSDPSNPYWIVLNSWGDTSGRPNGLFRLKMDMNYDNIYYYTDTYGVTWTYIQHKFYVLDAEYEPGEKIGLFRNGYAWYLDRSGDGKWGTGDTAYGFGLSGDVPVTGDWNGDGKTEIGLFRNGYAWYLDSNGDGKWGTGDIAYGFGLSGDKPVTGKW